VKALELGRQAAKRRRNVRKIFGHLKMALSSALQYFQIFDEVSLLLVAQAKLEH
jgi:hypothetical protein